MPNCENCTAEHNGSYGSGRFCTAKCARGFSTKGNRAATNVKVSNALAGRRTRPGNPKFWGDQMSPESRSKQRLSLKFWWQTQLESWIEHWLADPTFNPPSQEGGNSTIRRALIFLRGGEKCENCGWCECNPATGRIPVQQHHKDGNDQNNRPENLQLLCPNCHSLTSNWGARNRRAVPDVNPRR